MMSKTQYLPLCKVYIIIFSSNQLLIRLKVFFNNVHYCYFPFRYGNNETSMHWGSNIPVNCETESTEYPSSQCIFPYEYKGKTYYECVSGLFGYQDKNFWCPTDLDYDNQPYNWGRCGENCPSAQFRRYSTATSPQFARFASKLT